MLNYVLTHPKAKCPTRSRFTSAAYDLFTPERVVILSGEIKMINIHFRCELPRDHFGLILGRSKLATKGLVILGGVIDEDYRGDWIVCVSNISNTYIVLEAEAAVAQFIMLPTVDCPFHLVQRLSDTDRGESGILSGDSK